MNAQRNETSSLPFHGRYLELVAQLEREFRVARWKSGDVELWPLARMELHSDMYWASVGQAAPQSRSPLLPGLVRASRPVRNFWKSRRDLGHWVARPRPAKAIFLGDGVSLDRVDGEWQDRFGEPVIDALGKRGLDTFIMQGGGLARLPWHRPTFSANVVADRGAPATATRPGDFPDHEDVLQTLARADVRAPSLTLDRLARLAHRVSNEAARFERILRRVRPALAFVVTYYAGLGPAFLLACRRQGILSIDLQHCPQEGAHKAYRWSALPPGGYGTLPALFWNWTEREAADIQGWADTLPLPWHRSLHGGHTQLASFLNDFDPRTRAWDAKFASLSNGTRYAREILIALQPIGGQRPRWDALAAQIGKAPPDWRWWIRRHPSSNPHQDAEYAPLLALRNTNVLVEEASALPLPAVLRHMSAVISVASGASAEAAIFGVPALFLSDEARATFPRLIADGLATIVEARAVNTALARVPAAHARPLTKVPDLDGTLCRLEQIAVDYAQLCRTSAPGTACN